MDGDTTTSVMTAIIEAMGDVLGLMDPILDAILGNEILLFCFAAGFISVGIGVFRALKSASKA